MTRRRRASHGLLLLSLLGGCGTIGSFALGGSGVPVPPGTRLWPLGAVYCGVAMDLHLIQRGTSSGSVLALVDFPLSLCLDTLLLPLTLPLEVGSWLWRSPPPPRVDDHAPHHASDVAPVRSG